MICLLARGAWTLFSFHFFFFGFISLGLDCLDFIQTFSISLSFSFHFNFVFHFSSFGLCMDSSLHLFLCCTIFLLHLFSLGYRTQIGLRFSFCLHFGLFSWSCYSIFSLSVSGDFVLTWTTSPYVFSKISRGFRLFLLPSLGLLGFGFYGLVFFSVFLGPWLSYTAWTLSLYPS